LFQTIPKDILEKLKRNNYFKLITEIASEKNIEAYLVGGYVRDLFLNRNSKDVDVVIVGDGTAFAEAFAKKADRKSKLSIFKTYGTANVRFTHYEFEFVGARKESYQRTSRNPEVESGSLIDDLSRRDFTINALALSMNEERFGQMVDLFNGTIDLQDKVIRTPLEPHQTFSDDPLRMMRAIRFASQLGFSLYPETFEGIKKNNKRIEIITQERITDELNKIMLSPKPSVGLELLHQSGLLNIIFPELLDLKGTETVDNKSHKDNFYHTLKVLDNVAQVSNNLWLRWTALLHDIGKPVTKRFDQDIGWTFHAHDVIGARMVPKLFRRFKLPLGDKMKYVQKLVALHLRPVSLTKDDVTDSAIRRLIVDAGNDIDDLLSLCKADVTSKNQARVKLFLSRFDKVKDKIKLVTEKDKLRNWKNPITGDVIMNYFDIRPSKVIGDIKEVVKEAILEGEIKNDFDEAFELMKKIGNEMGLKKK
jgi:poly(A) polymerase